VDTHFTDATALEPEAIQVMSLAFELVCADLHVFGRDISGRQIIARRIIDLASKGNVEATALHKRLVAEARLSL